MARKNTSLSVLEHIEKWTKRTIEHYYFTIFPINNNINSTIWTIYDDFFDKWKIYA